MKIKVHDGTQPDSHLCRTCVASMVRVENSRQITLCHKMPSMHSVIHGRVTQCNGYESLTDALALAEHKALAWQLERDEDGTLVWSTPAERRAPARSRRRNSVRSVPAPDPIQVQ